MFFTYCLMEDIKWGELIASPYTFDIMAITLRIAEKEYHPALMGIDASVVPVQYEFAYAAGLKSKLKQGVRLRLELKDAGSLVGKVNCLEMVEVNGIPTFTMLAADGGI